MKLYSFSDLETFWRCHRLFAFAEQYRPIAVNEAIETGSIVHRAVSEYYKKGGNSWMAAIQQMVRGELDRAEGIADMDKHSDFIEAIGKAAKAAISLTSDYLTHIHNQSDDVSTYCTSDVSTLYIPKMVEGELTLPENRIVCHPDMVSFYQGKLCINDFKTGKSPDIRYLDLSGQCDFYAYVYEVIYQTPVEYIAYDIISDASIYSHIRKPRIEQGKRIAAEVMALPLIDLGLALDTPMPTYDCPRCLFLQPCWLYETVNISAAREYLEANYERREKN